MLREIVESGGMSNILKNVFISFGFQMTVDDLYLI